MTRLDYGLHHVFYTSWDDALDNSQRYVGHFQITEARPPETFDALAGSAPVAHYFAGGADDLHVLPRRPNGAGMLGAAGDGTITLLIDATIPVGTGIVVFHNLSDNGTVKDPADVTTSVLFRYNSTNWLMLRPYQNDTVGLVAGGQLGAAITGLAAADRKQWKIEVIRDSGSDLSGWKIYEGWDSTTDVADGDGMVAAASYGMHIHGHAGGFLYNNTQAGGSPAVPILHSFQVIL
jgi:hypothetical protein